MKILLVYPETPSTFWSFRAALQFVSKRSTEPPLGLLTLAAMLPETWMIKLVDMNVSMLTDEHLLWADYVFITGMNIQKASFQRVVKRCNELGIPVVAGGPMVTSDHREFLGVDHFVLNEAEITLTPFLADLESGNLKRVYSSAEFPDLDKTPIPMWQLLEIEKYTAMSMQYSRGCPFDCEFCSIVKLNGHRPRLKTTKQFLAELDSLYRINWKGHVFIVDDNFIGNKRQLKKELLPAMIEWSKDHNHPFQFGTEVSINIADDDQLLQLMADAGFEHAFVGIETPHVDSLAECGKKQNLQRDMLSAVKKLHHHGLRVSGGFILGFDHDPPAIFDQLVQFIQSSGIVTATVGLPNAPTGTRLFERLKKEDRLLTFMSGDNMDGSINFVPKMNYQQLIAGYKSVLESIYSQKAYYERVKLFLLEYKPRFDRVAAITLQDVLALVKSIWILGVREEGKRYYWKLFFFTLFKVPRKFPIAITMAIYGFHFRQVVKNA